MRALLLFLLSCLPCFAQLNVQQPMFQLSSAGGFNGTLQSIPGIHTYWVWTNGLTWDTSTPARLTNWASLVGNNNLKKAGSAATTCPSNATLGVLCSGYFQGNWLTNSSISFPTNQDYTLGIIQKMRRPNSDPTPVIYQSMAGPFTVTSGRQSDTNLIVDVRTTGSFSSKFSAGYIGTFRSDFIIVCSNNATPGQGGGIFAYIDGVLRTNKVDASFTNFASTWNIIGASAAAGGNYYDGYYFDIAFYTNIMTLQSISNFHYYNTNVYGTTGSGI